MRHAKAVLIACAVIAIAAALGATRLTTDAGTDTLVDSNTSSFKASERVRQLFGDDPVVILVRDDLNNLLQTSNLGRLLRLEGCLAANPPKKVKPLPGACTELAELHPVKLVTGPATFLNQAVIGIQDQFGAGYKDAQQNAQKAGQAAAERAFAQGATKSEAEQVGQAAASQVLQGFQTKLVRIAAQYGLDLKLPTLDNPNFISTVVFDNTKVGGVPKGKLSYLFPNSQSAQIIIRLRPGLSDSERNRALDLIREAVNDTTPRKACAVKGVPEPCFELTDGSYVVSGAPIVVQGLADVLQGALFTLFAAAILVMALTLLLVFRSRLRLLPLVLALGSAAVTFGALSLTGGRLTMASIAVAPVLIGLAVDYAIQLQARFDEEVEGGATGAAAAGQAAMRSAPVVGTACLATAAGFAVLQLSPTPMVRSFGLLLVFGIGVAFVLAMTAGFAALSFRSSRSAASGAGASGRGRARRAPGRLASRAPVRLTALRERAGRSLASSGRGALAVSIANPGRVLVAAIALAVCGWVAGTQTKTVSDIRELVPRDLPAVRDLDELQAATGSSGELDVLVQAPDLTDPALIEWMSRFKQRVLEANGFGGKDPACSQAELCPGPALTDFLTSPERGVTRDRVRALIAALPAYDLRGVITTNPKTGEPGNTANIAFGIRTQSLEAQQDLIDRVRGAIDPPGLGDPPPPGVEVTLAGLPVLASESATDISDSRYWLTLAGLLAVALVLLAVYRSWARALVPLVPIVLATGWSALVLVAMDIPINPMSAALGALVIAISTEFSVILAARYHEERGGGRSIGEALRRAYERTGAAVAASGVTAIAGFAALTASDIRMLRDFGVITVVDLGVALLGVMLVLPAALVWAERSARA